jgi:hypothetical protein
MNHMNFRNQYHKNHWYDPEAIPLFFHTTRIGNIPSILKNGLMARIDAENIPNRIDLGYKLDFSGCEYFVRLFHSDKTPFLYDRFQKVGGDNLAMLVVTADVLDDESISLFGMSTHGLAYIYHDYSRCYFMKKTNNPEITAMANYILEKNDANRFEIFENDPVNFYNSLTKRFNLPAKGNGWSRGDVLYSKRPAFPGYAEDEWGNIRAAEVLIFPRIPLKYIKYIAGTPNALSNIANLPNLPDEIEYMYLNDQGCF